MPLWRFRDYHPEGGGCPIVEWYRAQDVDVRAAFDATVADLAVTEDWNDPDLMSFDVFTRKPEHLGLAQVKFYVIQGQRKRHFRAVGLWRQQEREFIFLGGFEKSGRTTIPPEAFDGILRLRVELEENKGEIHEHE